MQYTRLGDTGLIVSRLAFGAMTFGTGKGPFAAVSKVGPELADQIIGKTLDAGINFFNTADGYTGGQSEEMLGKALQRHLAEIKAMPIDDLIAARQAKFRNIAQFYTEG